MSLSDLSSIGSLVSGIAVLVSLVYLNLQTRQAERNQQASIRAARTTRIIDLVMGTSEPSIADAVTKGMQGVDDMSDTQIAQFAAYASARFFNAEDSFYQHREGVLNAFSFDTVASGLRSSFESPGMRVIFKQQRGMMGRDFVAFANEILAVTPIAAGRSAAALFRANLAAEKTAAMSQA